MIRLGGWIMTAIKSHLSTAELEGRYETAADPISKSHFHGLWLLSKGLEIEEVAELLSFSTRWVYELVRRYNEGGPDCLGDQRVNNGAEARILTAAALAALKERITLIDTRELGEQHVALVDLGIPPSIQRWISQVCSNVHIRPLVRHRRRLIAVLYRHPAPT